MTLSNPAQYISGRTVQEQMNSLIDYVDTRAAEVATDAIASDVAQVHSDAADAHTDALAAAASASAAAGTLANAVKKTGEASQSIAGDVAVTGALDAASIGSGSTPVVCGNLTAFGSVSLDDTTLHGNLSGADSSALINLSGVGSVLVPAPTSNGEAATKKYVDDQDALDVHLTGTQTITGTKTVPLETTGTFSGQIASSQKVKNELDNYTPVLRTTGNQTITGTKTFQSALLGATIQMKTIDIDVTAPGTSTKYSNSIMFVDENGIALCKLWVSQSATGQIKLGCDIKNSDNSWKFGQIIAQGDVI